MIETQFAANVRVQAASMNWQTYDPTSSVQRGMARAFRCDADVAAYEGGVALSCKVPLDVADGTYYLTSISIQTGDSKRNYGWMDDLPADVEVQIKGGDALIMPHIKAIQVK